MREPELYLKQNVHCEPLFNQWYAWTHLIAPHTAAMFIANWHLKIMKSYVAGPQLHANAVKNPAMLGGPFIDYQGGRVNEIKGLIERTTRESAHMIEFAAAVKYQLPVKVLALSNRSLAEVRFDVRSRADQ